MTAIVRPGAGLLFMKVGTHAQETLEDIIARKTREIEQTGHALWGYGGNTCHPQSMVQPFAQAFEMRGQTIYLCMHAMTSNHFAEPVRADEFSVDGLKWSPIPAAINVKGSRYALVIKNLRQEEFELPLDQTAVAIGRSQGRAGDIYVHGRVDKACLEVLPGPRLANAGGSPALKINLVAELVAPFAGYVRNTR